MRNMATIFVVTRRTKLGLFAVVEEFVTWFANRPTEAMLVDLLRARHYVERDYIDAALFMLTYGTSHRHRDTEAYVLTERPEGVVC